jgi:nucleoid-associated protein YgaU
VLALGLCAAWPLRRTEPLRPPIPETGPPVAAPQSLLQPVPLSAAPSARGELLKATNASMTGPAAPPAAAAESSGPATLATLAVAAGAPFPSDGPDANVEKFRIHVVHEGDRLDRLAKRYLGDESRALELFDLNREVLDNPHLLPIGAELRVPAGRPPAGD